MQTFCKLGHRWLSHFHDIAPPVLRDAQEWCTRGKRRTSAVSELNTHTKIYLSRPQPPPPIALKWSFLKSLKTILKNVFCWGGLNKISNKFKKVWSRKINPGKIWKSLRLYKTFILKLFFCTILCCAQNKNLRILLKAENKALLQPYICEFWNKGLFVCLNHSCPWKQTLTWKTFQGNTLNQHPGINLQNAIQAWLSLEWMQAAYE